MDESAFRLAWDRMSFAERALVIEVAIQEFGDEWKVPVPPVFVVDSAGEFDEKGFQTRGETLFGVGDDMKEITVYAQSPGIVNTSEALIDDPWETLATAYHEAFHHVIHDTELKTLFPTLDDEHLIVEPSGIKRAEETMRNILDAKWLLFRDLETSPTEAAGRGRDTSWEAPGPVPPEPHQPLETHEEPQGKTLWERILSFDLFGGAGDRTDDALRWQTERSAEENERAAQERQRDAERSDQELQRRQEHDFHNAPHRFDP